MQLTENVKLCRWKWVLRLFYQLATANCQGLSKSILPMPPSPNPHLLILPQSNTPSLIENQYEGSSTYLLFLGLKTWKNLRRCWFFRVVFTISCICQEGNDGVLLVDSLSFQKYTYVNIRGLLWFFNYEFINLPDICICYSVHRYAPFSYLICQCCY